MKAARQMPPLRVLVSSWGTRQALEKLRQFFAVSPQMDLTQKQSERIKILPEETLEKLDQLTNGAMRKREEW